MKQLTPRLAPNIPFGWNNPGTRFFKVIVEFERAPSACVKVNAVCEGDIRANLGALIPRVNTEQMTSLQIRECGQFEAVLIRNWR